MEEKKKLRILKMQRTKMLRKTLELVDEFIELQDKIKEIEIKIKEIEKEEK